MCDHRVRRVAGQAPAHVVDGKDAEAVGGEGKQARDVEGSPVVWDCDLVLQIPRAGWIVTPVCHEMMQTQCNKKDI